MSKLILDKASRKLIKSWRDDWNIFARDVLRVRMDSKQQEILNAVQHNRRVSVCSGTSRGKDFLASVASVCGVYLMPFWDENGILRTSTVINTGPSDRQVKNIMMREIRSRYNGSLLPKLAEYGFYSGYLTKQGINFEIPKALKGNVSYANIEKWYMLGFKADDHNTEAWTGFHNDNMMIVATEASGLSKTLFEGMEGCLQGNSRFLLVFNPNNVSGEAYNSARDPQYKFFRLNSMDAPNVLNGIRYKAGEITEKEYRKLHIPGQVDEEWVNERVKKQGWTVKINKSEYDKSKYDFEWKGEYYRPSDVFKIKVLGAFPDSPDGKLIPLAWIEAAMERWQKTKERNINGGIRGVDVAGLGCDTTVFADRKENYVAEFKTIAIKKTETLHMELASLVKLEHETFKSIYIDTIGEGAGVYSRLADLDIKNAFSFKNSMTGKGLTDKTEARRFTNMRAYTYWAMRDWLDPKFDSGAMLPLDDELKAQLTEIEYKFKDDKIIIEPKDELKKRLGVSPDKADALAQTFAPTKRFRKAIKHRPISAGLC